MKLFRSDQLFEMACHSPEKSDVLLVRLVRARKWNCIGFLVQALMGLGFCGWGFVLVGQLSQSMASSGAASQEMMSLLYPLICLGGGLLSAIGLLFTLVVILHSDACIKVLLIARGPRKV